MENILRTPDKNFSELTDYPFEPNYYFWNGVRDYVDEGPKEGPVMLLLHGMPTWGYLYRDMIPILIAKGYRCIVPDHIGFGRSDKPSEPSFYSIARHTEVLSGLISNLGLKNITLSLPRLGRTDRTCSSCLYGRVFLKVSNHEYMVTSFRVRILGGNRKMEQELAGRWSLLYR